jgi:hypothetical protein
MLHKHTKAQIHKCTYCEGACCPFKNCYGFKK